MTAARARAPGPSTAPASPARASPSRCAPGAGNCATATGRIIYVEAVDGDGDGDAHLVLASLESITAPGLSVIDVERAMRPRRLPTPGTSVSAAGPVYRGTYGQRQIQATELHIAHRGADRAQSGR